MGYTWEVSAYRPTSDGYKYIQSYTGESFIAALWDMWKCKRDSGCVKLEWR